MGSRVTSWSVQPTKALSSLLEARSCSRAVLATEPKSTQPAVSARNLYVLNLPVDLSPSALATLFERFGLTHLCILVTVDSVGRRRAFVDLETSSQAAKAIASLHRSSIGSYTIEVSYAIVQRSEGPLTMSTSPSSPTRLPRLASFSPSTESTLSSHHTTVIITSLSPLPIRSSHELETLARPFGKVLNALLAKSVGVVIFASAEGARSAVRALDGRRMRGARMDVEIWEEWVEEEKAEKSCGSSEADSTTGRSSFADDASSKGLLATSEELWKSKTRKLGELDPTAKPFSFVPPGLTKMSDLEAFPAFHFDY